MAVPKLLWAGLVFITGQAAVLMDISQSTNNFSTAFSSGLIGSCFEVIGYAASNVVVTYYVFVTYCGGLT